MQNTENTNLADGSGTTGGSSGGSTDEQLPVQPLDVPEIPVSDQSQVKIVIHPTTEGVGGSGGTGREYSRGGWKLDELKKVKKTREKIIASYKAFKRPKFYGEARYRKASEFFKNEWPTRSPYAVYQKSQIIKKSKKIFVV